MRLSRRLNACLACIGLPCCDVDCRQRWLPDVDLEPDRVQLVLISECPAADSRDNYYKPGDAVFNATTVQAFRDAGVGVRNVHDLTGMGVYLTTAVKCRKLHPTIHLSTVERCSKLLGEELALFPNTAAYLLMGDVAIRAANCIACDAGQRRAIPPGATHSLRGGAFVFRGRPAFPSYLQAGPSFYIERSKRRMIAEDIAAAVSLL